MAGGWAIRPGLDEFLTRTDDFIHPPIWLVRCELFEAAGWFDEQHRTMEHYDMALRLASLTQWRFLDGGPVARGRFSKKGKWYSNIVNGTNEQRLPRIIENALTRLPTTPEGDATRRKARAAVCATIAGQKWWTGGGLEPTRTFLLTALRDSPWLLQERAVLEWVHRIATKLAECSTHPIGAVKDFWNEIRVATQSRTRAPSIATRQLLGEMLAATATGIHAGSPRRAWVIGASALLHDPQTWVRSRRLMQLCRALSD